MSSSGSPVSGLARTRRSRPFYCGLFFLWVGGCLWTVAHLCHIGRGVSINDGTVGRVGRASGERRAVERRASIGQAAGRRATVERRSSGFRVRIREGAPCAARNRGLRCDADETETTLTGRRTPPYVCVCVACGERRGGGGERHLPCDASARATPRRLPVPRRMPADGRGHCYDGGRGGERRAAPGVGAGQRRKRSNHRAVAHNTAPPQRARRRRVARRAAQRCATTEGGGGGTRERERERERA